MAALQSFFWSLAALLARVGIGGIFLTYGYNRLQNPEAAEQFFTSVGVPRPELAVTIVTWVELGGGALLVAGLLLPLAGTVLAGLMLGAWWYTQQPEAVLALPRDTYELELALAAGALLIGFSGGGKVSLDHLFSAAASRSRGTREDNRFYVTGVQAPPDTGQVPTTEYPTGQYFPPAPQPPAPQPPPGPPGQTGSSTSVFGPWSHNPGDPPRR